jgi:hypothetical protein
MCPPGLSTLVRVLESGTALANEFVECSHLDFGNSNGVLRIVAISATTRNTPIKFEALPRDPTSLQVHHTGPHRVLPSQASVIEP